MKSMHSMCAILICAASAVHANGWKAGDPAGASDTAPVRATVVPAGAALETMPPIEQQAAPRTANVPSLELGPEKPIPPTVTTVAVARVMMWGLGRSFCNMTLSPGELARGYTYEYSTPEPWYLSTVKAPVAGIGGTLGRMCAGMADLFTLGYFGDTQLAPGFPDYVWQGDWLYRPESAVPTTDTSGGKMRVKQMKRDLGAGADTRRTRGAAGDDVDESVLDERRGRGDEVPAVPRPVEMVPVAPPPPAQPAPETQWRPRGS